jgi:hypothetical protein
MAVNFPVIGTILDCYILIILLILGTIPYYFCRSICVKDQLSDFLPALLQIMHGIEATGLTDVIKKSPEIWQPVFGIGNSFEITTSEFLDQLVALYSESQRKKMAEIDTFKYFCDAIESISEGR